MHSSASCFLGVMGGNLSSGTAAGCFRAEAASRVFPLAMCAVC